LKRILRSAFQEEHSRFNKAAWVLFSVPAGPVTVKLSEFRKTAVELLNRL
jgi:hypothetical protein